MSEGLFIPENLDVFLFGGSGKVGSLFKERLVKDEVPLFAPSQELIDLHHAEYVKMLIESTSPKFIINCASYSGENEELISHTNTLIPFTLSQICFDLDIPWMHILRSHPSDSSLAKASEEALRIIRNSETRCYICKASSVSEQFIDECLNLKNTNAEYKFYEF
tara:strand:- start:680 stop:1171 length:492 start_codon:yes stop_codon:yes gene_type:complete